MRNFFNPNTVCRFVYPLYGIALASEFPFRNLGSQSRRSGESCKRVFFLSRNCRSPHYSRPVPLLDNIYYQRGLNPRFIYFSFPIAGGFHVDLLKKLIHWRPSSSISSRDLAQHFVAGPLLGFALPHFGPTLTLHGCVLATKRGAIALLAPQGGGKSTLASHFLQQGTPLLSDDLVVIQKRRNSWVVQPGPPEIRLWPDTAQVFVKRGIKSRIIYRGTKKKRISLSPKGPLRFAGEKPLPLKALFCLSRRADGEVQIQHLQGKRAFLEILRARYNHKIPERPKVLKNQFRLAGELIKKVPLNRLVYPSGLRHLPRVADTVLRHCTSLNQK